MTVRLNKIRVLNIYEGVSLIDQYLLSSLYIFGGIFPLSWSVFSVEQPQKRILFFSFLGQKELFGMPRWLQIQPHKLNFYIQAYTIWFHLLLPT